MGVVNFSKYEKLREKILGRSVVVAIDGPSGSGKSTIARNVAAALDLGYLDTGAMYRAAAWWVDRSGVDLDDAIAVEQTVKNMKLEVKAVPHAPRIFVDGIDVKHAIRTDKISEIVSKVSSNMAVRVHLIEAQRDLIEQAIASTRGIVVEGRDITTVVAPEATVRILLTASPEVRLARRSLADRGDVEAQSLQKERSLVLDRDAKDSKVTDFLEAAEGVATVDSTNLSVDETLDSVMSLIDQATS